MTTLNNLNLYKKALPNLKLGSGSATAYINSYSIRFISMIKL